jgi:hypothetical protein
MPEMRETPDGNLDPAQAADLALLVDLEARWENLRDTPAQAPDVPSATRELHGKQKTYEDFRSKLAAYNKGYAPAHVPELLLNTPARLGAWCRRMRDLYLRVEHDPRGHCPAHLLAKAYRWADLVAARVNEGRVRRSPPPGTIRAAIRGLEDLARWCEELTRAS